MLRTTKRRWRTATILATTVLLVATIGPMASANHITDPDGTISWGGLGTDSERCDLAGTEDRPLTGWIHWVLTTGGNDANITDAQIRINGTDVYHRKESNSSATHFFTPFYDLDGLTGVAEYLGTAGTNAQLVISDYCDEFPSTTLSLDTSGLDVAGVSAYDPVTNRLIVAEGSSVTLDATETNDGTADLTNAYVEFDGVTCTDGNMVPDPGVNLAAGADLDVECAFTATVGETLVTLTGHGTYDGKDVTWCANPTTPPADVICDQDEYDEITIVGINPSTDLDLDVLNSSTSTDATEVGEPKTYVIDVDYGGTVNLQFVELNDGTETDDTLTDVEIEFLNGAPECVDTAGGVTLEPTETHTVTCDPIEDITAHRTITAIGHGTDALGNDVTWCEDPTSPPAMTVCDQDEIVIVMIRVNFGEGCTPGLWRQYDTILGRGPNARVHWIEGEWADSPYGYDDNAGTVFGVSEWDAYTLGELTKRGGGGEAALGRHASAALQNILHPDIDYFGYPTGAVGAAMLIQDVQDAFAAGPEAIEALHTMLADLNEQGDCELSNS